MISTVEDSLTLDRVLDFGPRQLILWFRHHSQDGEVGAVRRGNSLGLGRRSREERDEPQSCTAMKQRDGGRHGNGRGGLLSRQTVAACGGTSGVLRNFVCWLSLGRRTLLSRRRIQSNCALVVCEFFIFFVFRAGVRGGTQWEGGGVMGRLPQSHQQAWKHAEEAS